MRTAKLRYKFRMFVRTLPYHLLVMGSVFIVSTIFNKYFEAVCFLSSFCSLRYKFPTTYHSDSIVLCMTFTIAIFTLSVVICPPIYMYLLVSILFAYFDCAVLYFVQNRLDLMKVKKDLTKQAEDLQARLDEKCKDTRAEILEKCAKANLSERNTKIAEMYFVERKTAKQIWQWLCSNNENMEIDSLYVLLNRIAKKINQN